MSPRANVIEWHTFNLHPSVTNARHHVVSTKKRVETRPLTTKVFPQNASESLACQKSIPTKSHANQ
jgi:hypothetical protein